MQATAKILPFPQSQGASFQKQPPGTHSRKGSAAKGIGKKKLKQREARKMENFLLQRGLVDLETITRALEIQAKSKKNLGTVLIEMGVADDAIVARGLARECGIPFVGLDNVKIPRPITTMVTSALARQHQVMPLKMLEKKLAVAMADPKDIHAMSDLGFATGKEIQRVAAPAGQLRRCIERHYAKDSKQSQKGLSAGEGNGVMVVPHYDEQEQEVSEVLITSERSPIVKLTNALFSQAIRREASDIHIEPQQNKVMVRFRIDGILTEVTQLEKHVHTALVSRLKIIAGMDISIRRKPQDGKVRIMSGGKEFDLRVSSIPTYHGEKVVIRVLRQDQGLLLMEEMHLPENVYRDMSGAMEKNAGMILVTGPTGSGKSTTLYGCLYRLRSPSVNIVTVEDPVEYEMEGINQVQINSKAGISFSAGLRSILRQDPDVIMVGEIRDAETAHTAMQAAQTGHLVFSTLHTNDAPSAIVRLMELGVEPYLIASTLLAALAQRLVRRNCPHCLVPDEEAHHLLERFPKVFRKDLAGPYQKGAGCKLCGGSGFTGRMGVYEMVRASIYLKEVLRPGTQSTEILRAASKSGYLPLALDGLHKASGGMTSIGEVFRVASVESEVLEILAAQHVTRENGQGSNKVDCPAPSWMGNEGRKEDSAREACRPLRVVAADDNKVIRTIIKGILSKEGYEVIMAENGLEALKHVMLHKPDLIITDVLMPELGGIGLVQKLRTQMATRNIPIIMLTAKSEQGCEKEALGAGADCYLSKPVDKRKLMQMITRLTQPKGD